MKRSNKVVARVSCCKTLHRPLEMLSLNSWSKCIASTKGSNRAQPSTKTGSLHKSCCLSVTGRFHPPARRTPFSTAHSHSQVRESASGAARRLCAWDCLDTKKCQKHEEATLGIKSVDFGIRGESPQTLRCTSSFQKFSHRCRGLGMRKQVQSFKKMICSSRPVAK